VAVAPSWSRWRPGPGFVLLVVVTAGSVGKMAVLDRVLGGLHVLAGAVWLGLVIEVAARWIDDPAAGRKLLHRLSTPALGALVAVATTGTIVASDHLGDARLALGSWWGRGLAVKIVLVVTAAVLGALVRRGWTPRLEGVALTSVAVIGLFLAVAGSPLSAGAPPSPFFARSGGTDVLIAPLQAGSNTVVVRSPTEGEPVTFEVDGSPVELEVRADGLQVGEVDLRAGRHQIRLGDQITPITVGPERGGVVVRAALPDLVEDPDCLDGLAGLAAATAALSTSDRPVTFELEVGGDTCGPDGGFSSLEPVWVRATLSGLEGMRARGISGTLSVITDASTRSRRVVDALRAEGVEFQELPAEQFDLETARTIQLGSIVVVATDPDSAPPIVDLLADANGATVPVLLAPWLLDAGVMEDIAEGGVTALLAVYREPTSTDAVSYRGGAARTIGGGWAATAAGFEAYLAAHQELTGVTAAAARPGVFSASRVNIMPSDLDHPSESGWARGVGMIRVA
jgi:hypothetical protein